MTQTLSEPVAAADYRSFSPRLAPALSITGSVLAIVGALGVWVRIVEVTPAGVAARAGSINGASHTWGWVLAVFAVAVGLASTQWNSTSLRILAPLSMSVVAVTFIAFRLRWAGDIAGKLAFKAGTEAGRAFTTYHAGFGWGSWLLALGAVSIVLGAVVGTLRALDVRRGLAS